MASLLTAYSREDTYVVWKSIESVLEDLGEVMERLEGVYDEYCAFVAALIRVPAGMLVPARISDAMHALLAIAHALSPTPCVATPPQKLPVPPCSGVRVEQPCRGRAPQQAAARRVRGPSLHIHCPPRQCVCGMAVMVNSQSL